MRVICPVFCAQAERGPQAFPHRPGPAQDKQDPDDLSCGCPAVHAGVRSGLVSVNGTPSELTGSARLQLNDIVIINMCDVKLALDPRYPYVSRCERLGCMRIAYNKQGRVQPPFYKPEAQTTKAAAAAGVCHNRA
jgi:hypothetical protein